MKFDLVKLVDLYTDANALRLSITFLLTCDSSADFDPCHVSASGACERSRSRGAGAGVRENDGAGAEREARRSWNGNGEVSGLNLLKVFPPSVNSAHAHGVQGTELRSNFA